jgi:hypothetical protein
VVRHLFRRDLLSYAVVGLAVCLTVVASLQLAPMFGFPSMPGAVLGGSSDVALPKSAEKRQVASRQNDERPAAQRQSTRTETAAGGAERTTTRQGGADSGVRSRRDATSEVGGGSATPTGGGTTPTTPGSTASPAPATPTTGDSSSAPADGTTSTPATPVASAARALRLNLVSVARIASATNSSSSKATTQGSVALRFAVADATSGAAAEGVPAGVSVNVAIPETPDQAPTSEALRVQVEMLDPAAAAAAGTDTTPAGVDDVALRVRLALSDAKVEDPVFTQAPAAAEGVSNTVNVWVPLDAKGKDDADPVKPVETEAAPASGNGDQPAADTAASAEIVIPVTTGEGAPASSTQTVPLPVTGETPPSGEPAGDKATPVVVQVESATEPPAEPPAAPQPSEEEPAQKPEPVATPEPAAPQDDDDDDCKDDSDHAADRAEAADAAAAPDSPSADDKSSSDDGDDDDD